MYAYLDGLRPGKELDETIKKYKVPPKDRSERIVLFLIFYKYTHAFFMFFFSKMSSITICLYNDDFLIIFKFFLIDYIHTCNKPTM